MALSKFSRDDLLVFKRAIAQMPHSAIDDLDTLFGQDTRHDNASKDARATRILRHLEDGHSTDADLLKVVNTLFVAPLSAEQRDSMPAFQAVRAVLKREEVAYREGQGFYFLESGPRSPNSTVHSITRNVSTGRFVKGDSSRRSISTNAGGLREPSAAERQADADKRWREQHQMNYPAEHRDAFGRPDASEPSAWEREAAENAEQERLHYEAERREAESVAGPIQWSDSSTAPRPSIGSPTKEPGEAGPVAERPLTRRQQAEKATAARDHAEPDSGKALSRFKRADRPYFRRAIASRVNEQIEAIDRQLDIRTFRGGVTRTERASEIVEHVFKHGPVDQAFVDIVNFLFFDEMAEREREADKDFVALRDEVLARRGVLYDEDLGFQFKVGEPVGGAKSTKPTVRNVFEAADSAPEQDLGPSHSGPGYLPPDHHDPRAIFVVKGRDSRPVDELERFLDFLNLTVMRWTDARKLVAKPQPSTFEIVQTGLRNAGAVIVVLSPDDHAALRKELREEEDGSTAPSDEGYQPRQNVLLEAGLAYGMDPDKVIFVQSTSGMRAISDIEGFNFIRMDGSWTQREHLVESLRAAGVDPTPKRTNLGDRLAGPFKVDG